MVDLVDVDRAAALVEASAPGGNAEIVYVCVLLGMHTVSRSVARRILYNNPIRSPRVHTANYLRVASRSRSPYIHPCDWVRGVSMYTCGVLFRLTDDKRKSLALDTDTPVCLYVWTHTLLFTNGCAATSTARALLIVYGDHRG